MPAYSSIGNIALQSQKKRNKSLKMIEIVLKIVLQFCASIASKYLEKFYFSGFETSLYEFLVFIIL